MAALLAHKWIAAVVGVLLAGLPVLLLTSWLYRQGEPEVLVAAKASIRVTELIIDETKDMFAELDARGVRSCGSSDVQTLQRMVFAIDQAHCGAQQLSRIDINDGLVVGHEFIGYQRALEVRVPARRLLQPSPLNDSNNRHYGSPIPRWASKSFFNLPPDHQAPRVETGLFGSAHLDGGGTYTRIRRRRHRVHRRKRWRPRCAPAQAPAAEEAKIVWKGRAKKPLGLWLPIELPSSQIVCIEAV